MRLDIPSFIRGKPANRETIGKPFLSPSVEIRDLKPGEVKVFARGKEASWDGMPDDPGTACYIEARGIVFTPRKGIAEKIHSVLSQPVYHPRLLSGILASRNLKNVPGNDPDILFRVYNLQLSKGMQYVTEMAARRMEYGILYTQLGVPPSIYTPPPHLFFTTDPLNLLHRFTGQIQVLEVGNGTALIMEMSAFIARTSAPTCSIAADASFIPDWLGGDRGVRQRIEQRLRNLYRSGTR